MNKDEYTKQYDQIINKRIEKKEENRIKMKQKFVQQLLLPNGYWDIQKILDLPEEDFDRLNFEEYPFERNFESKPLMEHYYAKTSYILEEENITPTTAKLMIQSNIIYFCNILFSYKLTKTYYKIHNIDMEFAFMDKYSIINWFINIINCIILKTSPDDQKQLWEKLYKIVTK